MSRRESTTRRKYVKPTLEVVKLVPEESLLPGCKNIISLGPENYGGACLLDGGGPCLNDGS